MYLRLKTCSTGWKQLIVGYVGGWCMYMTDVWVDAVISVVYYGGHLLAKFSSEHKSAIHHSQTPHLK